MRQKLEGFLRCLLPNLGDILWIGAFAGALGMGPRMMNMDGDLGRHLTIGQYILSQGQVPLRDLFSHTLLGQPVTPHEWLSQVIFALAYRALDFDGVVLVSGFVIATSFWLVFRRARAMSQAILAPVLLVILALAASSLHWLTRPHIFTFLMLALWVNLLESLRAGRLDRWWQFPILMLLWANLHGAFVAGFVTWAIYGAGLAWDAVFRRFPQGKTLHGRFWRYYLLSGGSAFLATLINPSGFELWGTSVGYVGNRYLVTHTAEYMPPNFHLPSAWPFLILVGLAVVLFGLQSKRQEAAHVLTTAAWMVMSLYSARNIPLFVIVAAPVLAGALAELAAGSQHLHRSLARFHQTDLRLLKVDSGLRGVLWPVALLVFFAVGFAVGGPSGGKEKVNTFDPRVFPVHAVDWLREHPQTGNTFNYFPWGGYLLHRMWPDQKVFIDGQTDFYGESLTRQYEQVLTLAPGWQDVLDQYQVDWVIMPAGQPLVGELSASADWQPVYQDGAAAILVRAGK